MSEKISICICTFKRPALFDTLESLANLEGIDECDIDVVIADNDDTDVMRSRVAEFAATYRYQVQYVHAPARNISIARNAALANARGRWAAFIDDDEVADVWWLASLLKSRGDAVAVVGQCIARYPAGLPDWLRLCDFHSNRIANDPVNAYTSNVLLDLEFLREKRILFRKELGQTGGEDTIFFKEISRAGGSIIYRPAAIVYEPVVPSRANMRWVRRRKFRAGQTHALMCREFEPNAFRWLLVTAGVKSLASFAASILLLPGSVRSRGWQARGVLHFGAVCYWIWPNILKEYS